MRLSVFKPRTRRGIVASISLTTLACGALAATAYADSTAAPYDILLGVGSDETSRNLAWYAPGDTDQKVLLEETKKLSAGEFNAKATVIDAVEKQNWVGTTTARNARATLSGLKPNTTYAYKVGADGAWSPKYTFTTGNFGKGQPFSFLFLGDPQIGSSGDAVADGKGWAATLAYTRQHDADAELLVSGGDQVESANNEDHWNNFADSGDVLKQVAWASTIGNHESGGQAILQHNFTPNTDNNASFYPGGNTTTAAGGDYWFTYKGVLFIDINSNAYNSGSDPAHVAYVKDVIAKHGAGTKWTTLVYHHSIYSPAAHANDSDNKVRRQDFTTEFSKLGVDLVLQGHDHSYSRSYEIKNGTKANASETPDQPQVDLGPGGVIYVTANSASGSKYYDLTAPSDPAYGADPLDNSTGRKRHWANAAENQEHVRSYLRVDVKADKLELSAIRAGDCADLTTNPAVARNNVTWCGNPANTTIVDPVTKKVTGVQNNVPVAPIGSLIDRQLYTQHSKR
ncbi:metallophosphoesterase family protein [Kribbella sp.]|uniref:metallophosphoesterase family protein n=1 Tax=Kribbella sp. TaxID=1871183 RepID=UPI002D2FF111|nr:metallophosphoesterase family protein [Kribbella sp.]HZX08653.1 metallophosphoesterase family protein [Kribbella sp.]